MALPFFTLTSNSFLVLFEESGDTQGDGRYICYQCNDNHIGQQERNNCLADFFHGGP